VCSHRSASQDTLRNCAKCRGILARARLEASLAWRQMRLSIDRVADGTRVFLLRTAIRQNRTLSHRLSPEETPRAHRPHSHPSSSNPKNRPKVAVRRLCCKVQRPSVLVVKYPEVRLVLRAIFKNLPPEPSSCFRQRQTFQWLIGTVLYQRSRSFCVESVAGKLSRSEQGRAQTHALPTAIVTCDAQVQTICPASFPPSSPARILRNMQQL
jgi:hypothetical protein